MLRKGGRNDVALEVDGIRGDPAKDELLTVLKSHGVKAVMSAGADDWIIVEYHNAMKALNILQDEGYVARSWSNLSRYLRLK